MSSDAHTQGEPAASAAGDSPFGTDLAAWQVEMAALQESYAEKRAAWRNSVVGPVLPPEKRKKGRPS